MYYRDPGTSHVLPIGCNLDELQSASAGSVTIDIALTETLHSTTLFVLEEGVAPTLEGVYRYNLMQNRLFHLHAIILLANSTACV